MPIGKKAEALILNFEGWDTPWNWPGGASGITIPFGYDLGYEESFAEDWQGLMSDSDFARLKAVVSFRGTHAASVAYTLRGIHISRDAANHVFDNITLPRYEALTVRTFPNADKLPADAFGALVSLVYNRGESLKDHPGCKPRTEMRAIRDILATRDTQDADTLREIAKQVRDQARYWKDVRSSDSDLHDRRMDEAALIESCIA